MISILKSHERGSADHGWLKSYHTFSFANYYNPERMGFNSLRVINEDFIAGGGGFPTHGHKNMEIITVVLSGALEHKDSLGNQSIIKPGEVQKMSAGNGIHHSEYNHFKDKETHLYQIWIEPNRSVPTNYQQIDFSKSIQNQTLTLVASSDGKNGSITVAQNMMLFIGTFKHESELEYKVSPNHQLWLQQISGEMMVGPHRLSMGDAISIIDEESIQIKGKSHSTFLLFDLY